jgi:carbon storage regulator
MLVLSRKVGQRVLIGDDIAITIVRVSGGGVRLGIEAPTSLTVVREELQQQLAQLEAEGEVTAPPNKPK